MESRCDRGVARRIGAGLPGLAWPSAYRVISTKRRGGKVQLHVLSDSARAGFEPLQPNLEDVYFTALAEEHQPA